MLVDFYADWCGPCRMIAPILIEVNHELADDVLIAKVDVDKNPIISAKYGIRSIPTLKLFINGKDVQTIIGLQPKAQLVSMLKNYL